MGLAVVAYFVAVASALIPAASDGVGGALGVVVMGVLGLVCALVVRRIDRRRGMSLPQIFLIAMAMRTIVATFVHYVIYNDQFLGLTGLFAPDEIAYLYQARINAERILGHAPQVAPEWLEEHWSAGFVHVVTWCFVLFGHVAIVPKMLASMLGAWTSTFTALIADELFPGTGRRAAWMSAVFPSLVLWTSMVLKDGPALFGAELVLLSVVLRFGRTRLGFPAAILMIACGTTSVAVSRSYEVGFLIFAVVGGMFIGGGRHFVRNVGLFVVVSIMLVFVLQRFVPQPVDFSGDESPLARVAAIRSGFAEGAGSAIKHDIVDVRSPVGLLMWLPIGLFYFFLSPIPFTGTSIISIATTPEMLVWYAFLPALWRGLRRAMRDHLRSSLPMLLYALVSSIGWSMLVTNVGTIYRFRAQILFIPLILIAYDQHTRAQARARLRTASDPVDLSRAVTR